jgi:hypothetical protein
VIAATISSPPDSRTVTTDITEPCLTPETVASSWLRALRGMTGRYLAGESPAGGHGSSSESRIFRPTG